ncbi:hypothetical protein [Streptacidiphilus cavernicola]|uniref:Calcium-binding protein n=1 Tax=Streptacidiphilus cavernicola TaxID=3342716 RepID=A0ABV6VSX0_9ACTN
MRRRSAALLASGALAVGGLLLPGIQRHESSGDARFLGVSVNGDNPVVLGPDGSSDISFSITAEDGSGVASVDRVGLWGPNQAVLPASATHCTAKTAKISVCTGTSSVDVSKKQIFDDMAGQWYVQATVHGRNGDERTVQKAGRFSIKKDGQLTEFGTPHTAEKGSQFTIGGQLKRPDWDHGTWVVSPFQEVLVEFCAKGCTTETRVAAGYTDANGLITATVRATETGIYTLTYQGKFWAEPVQSTPAQVTVD